MWSLIRTRHKRQPLGLTTYNVNTLSDPTSTIIKVEKFNGSYTNETLEWGILSVGTLEESSFIDCTFPELTSLEIDQPACSAFIRCRFPKLRVVRIKEGEEVFYGCSFSRLHPDELQRRLFSNCHIERASHDYTFLYQGQSELDW